MLQDPDGQVIEAVSISAGLDYPGIGPQLSALMQAGRLVVSSATDTEAVAAMRQVARTEGILAAVESAHAVAALPDVLARLAVEPGSGSVGSGTSTPRGAPAVAGPLPREAVIVLGLSGRGDKDLAAIGGPDSRVALGSAQPREQLATNEVDR
jgi:tryptophan synthase beta chain